MWTRSDGAPSAAARLNERCVWLRESETLDQARAVIGAQIDNYSVAPAPSSSTGAGHRPTHEDRQVHRVAREPEF